MSNSFGGVARRARLNYLVSAAERGHVAGTLHTKLHTLNPVPSTSLERFAHPARDILNAPPVLGFRGLGPAHAGVSRY